jgi:hypothetical protein
MKHSNVKNSQGLFGKSKRSSANDTYSVNRIRKRFGLTRGYEVVTPRSPNECDLKLLPGHRQVTPIHITSRFTGLLTLQRKHSWRQNCLQRNFDISITWNVYVIPNCTIPDQCHTAGWKQDTTKVNSNARIPLAQWHQQAVTRLGFAIRFIDISSQYVSPSSRN